MSYPRPQGWYQPPPPRPSAAEKAATWVLWTCLVLLSLCGSGVFFLSGLLWWLVRDFAASLDAPTGEHATQMTAWSLVLSFVLLMEPWLVLVVVLRGLKRERHVWYWPVTALIVAVAIIVDLVVAGS
ncbi:MAG: hypothetical protein ACRC20_02110 [Segniliparus sp.]|uniref:hypothetical protein n=1 Tax=Segniliparus sp. TaxID=2804064 RepID=UPI003F3684C7